MRFSQQVATSRCVDDTISRLWAELHSYQRDRKELEIDNVELHRNLGTTPKGAKDIELQKALEEENKSKEQFLRDMETFSRELSATKQDLKECPHRPLSNCTMPKCTRSH